MARPKGIPSHMKGKTRDVTWGAAISAATKGHPKSRDHAAKISAVLKGRHLSDQAKARISAAAIGRPSPMKGLRKLTSPDLITTGVSGERHWNWRGGVATEHTKIRNSPEYKAWRDAVFHRDKYRCKKCGTRPRWVEAHHVQSFSINVELRFDVDNGITLCRECHKEVTNNERHRDATGRFQTLPSQALFA